jgi:hypothetical protein
VRPAARPVVLGAWLLASCFPTLTGAPCYSDTTCPTGQICLDGGTCDYGARDAGMGGGSANGGGTAAIGGGTAAMGGGTAMGGGAAATGGGTAMGGGSATGGGGGVMQFSDGHPCSAPSDCMTGTCQTYYSDFDHDTFGTLDGGQKFCGASPPSNYVTNTDDCCDFDSNVFTGQMMYFDNARNAACGPPGYDFNCNGADDPQPLDAGCCLPPQQMMACDACAICIGWGMPGPAGCGQTADQVVGATGGPMGVCLYSGTIQHMMVKAKCR